MPITSAVRVAAGMLAATLTGALVAVVPGQPALASVYHQIAPKNAWHYTDSRSPLTSTDVLAQNPSAVPLGTWRDSAGKHHISRSYVTFDLSAYAGAKVYDANIFFVEKKVNDCTKRAIDVWSTADATTVTWDSPPAPVALLGSDHRTDGLCPRIIQASVTDAVRAAVTAGRQSLSIEVRVSEEAEGDLAYGRTIFFAANSIQLSVGFNTPPTVDSTKLFTSSRPCSTEAPGRPLPARSKILSAMFHDVDEFDENRLTGEWAIWPVDHPEQRTVLMERARNGYQSGVATPENLVVDGGHYAWQTRVSDGADVSDWSTTCYFAVDDQAPQVAPGVLSDVFPESETGVWAPGGTPGVFTFTSGGVDDVVAYQYSWDGVFGVPVVSTDDRGTPIWHEPTDGPGYVRPSVPGGPASITVSPPGMVNSLRVRSVDAAGNTGPETTYRFQVQDTAPAVTINDRPVQFGYEVGYGEPLTLHFAPHQGLTSVVEYIYHVEGEPEQTVAAGPDGTAVASFTPQLADFLTLSVRSRSANGWVSPEMNVFLFVVSGPKVSSDVYPNDPNGNPLGGVGVTGSFTFAPRLPGTTGYAYSFDWAEPTTVPAGADGTATVNWTPESSGYHVITVWSLDADGNGTAQTEYFITVA